MSEDVYALRESLISQNIPIKWVIIYSLPPKAGESFDQSFTHKRLTTYVIHAPGSTIYSAINLGIEHASDFYIVAGSDDQFIPYSFDANLFEQIIDSDSYIFLLNTYISNVLVRSRNKPLLPSIFGASRYAASHAVGIIFKTKIHEIMGKYDTSFFLLADTKLLLQSFIRFPSKIAIINSAVGIREPGGVSYRSRILADCELFRITLELGYPRILALGALFLRLLLHNK